MKFDYISLRRLERFFTDLKTYLSNVYTSKDEMVPITNAEIDDIFVEGVTIGGRKYPYVQIGNQLWITENLDYKWTGLTVGASGTSDSEPRANYYNNNENAYGVNGNKYGLLYNYPAVSYLEQNKSTLLPDGWHVPSVEEYNALIDYVGGSSVAGSKLKSTSGWSSGTSTDEFGFSVLPTGCYFGSFSAIGSESYLYTKTPIELNNYLIQFNTASASNVSVAGRIWQGSLRLVKTVS